MSTKNKIARALKLGLVFQAHLSIAAANRGAADQPILNHPELSPTFTPNESYAAATRALISRAEFIAPPQYLFNESVADRTLYGVSSSASRDGERYVLAYYAIDNGADIRRFEFAVYDKQWNRLQVYTQPGQNNFFYSGSDFNQLNLRTIAGKGNGLLMFSRAESDFNVSGEIYVYGYAPSTGGNAVGQVYTIESSSGYTIDNFAVSLSPNQASVLLVTGTRERSNDYPYVKLNAYLTTTESSISQDSNLNNGLIIANNASNPDITHYLDNSALIVYERKDNQSIYLQRYSPSPDFTELQGETYLLSNRTTPKCLRINARGECIIATIGTATLDNRVYLSRIDSQGQVLDDKAVTAHHINTSLTLGELRLQDNKIILPVTQAAQGAYQLLLNIFNTITLGRVSGRSEFEVAMNISTNTIEVLPVSANQTDAIYIKDNSILMQSIDTTNRPPVVIGNIAPVNVDLNTPFTIAIVDPFTDSDNDQLNYSLTTPSGSALPGDLRLVVSQEQQLFLESSGLSQVISIILRLQAEDNAGQHVYTDFSFRVMPSQTNTQTPTSLASTQAMPEPAVADTMASSDNSTFMIAIISVLSCLGLSAIAGILFKLTQNSKKETQDTSESSSLTLEPIYNTLSVAENDEQNYQTIRGGDADATLSADDIIYNTIETHDDGEMSVRP